MKCITDFIASVSSKKNTLTTLFVIKQTVINFIQRLTVSIHFAHFKSLNAYISYIRLKISTKKHQNKAYCCYI